MGKSTNPAAERLAEKVTVDAETSCHNWTGYIQSAGYGSLRVEGRSVLTHRLAYELARGPIPVGLVIDHLCRNRRCCNPDHLEAVTNHENLRRGEGITAKPKTHCPKGHAYDADNTRINRQGAKVCRACEKARDSWGPYAEKINAVRRARSAAARVARSAPDEPLPNPPPPAPGGE